MLIAALLATQEIVVVVVSFGTEGFFVAGFSASYGTGTNTEAELAAVRDGLKLCIQLSLTHINLDSDSCLVVDWLMYKSEVYMWLKWEEVMEVRNAVSVECPMFLGR